MSMNQNQHPHEPSFQQRVNHIQCGVTNCAYHSENNCCHADTIQVQPCTSCCTSQDDTACKTFREKSTVTS